MRTIIKKIPKEDTKPICTFYCRNVKVENRDFAIVEAEQLGYKTLGRYIDAMLDSRREADLAKKAKKKVNVRKKK